MASMLDIFAHLKTYLTPISLATEMEWSPCTRHVIDMRNHKHSSSTYHPLFLAGKMSQELYKQIGVHHLFVLGLVEDIGEAALATVLSVKVGCHEDAGSTLFVRAFPTQTCDLSVLIHLDITNTTDYKG